MLAIKTQHLQAIWLAGHNGGALGLIKRPHPLNKAEEQLMILNINCRHLHVYIHVCMYPHTCMLPPHEMETTGWAAPEKQYLRYTAGLHMH